MGLCDLTKDKTKYGKYSKEWYTKNLPEGVTFKEYKDSQIYLNIDTTKYTDVISQVGIINWIELNLLQLELEVYYSFDEGYYMSAKTIREMNGYDNNFFEKGG